MALLTALLDANVLYPAGLRDFLLRLADQSLYAPLWSADIHAEWIGSVLADHPDHMEDVLERTRAVMDRHFPDAVVTGYSARAAGLDLPDPNDIHVLAAAIEGEADMIVTRNLRDFPADRLGLPSDSRRNLPTRSSSTCSMPTPSRCSRPFGVTGRR